MLTLAIYCLAIFAASLLGGWLPGTVRMTHTRTQLVMSFVAGLMLGVAVHRLLPNSLLQLDSAFGSGGSGAIDGNAIDTAVGWVMLGMVLMLMMLRLFHFHQHDFSHEEPAHHQERQSLDAHPLSWAGVALGLGLHALIDGVALGAAVKSGDLHGGAAGLAGFGVFLAITMHKPLDALSIITLMRAGGWSERSRWLTNIGFAALCPLTAILFVWGVDQIDGQEVVLGCALAFAAGVFLCISLGDILPEVHFHSHDRLKLTLSFLGGIGLAYGLRYIDTLLDPHPIGAMT